MTTPEESAELIRLMLGMDDTPIVREGQCKRSPFSWPGGKMDSASKIHPHLPYRNSYIEPFGGAGTILLQRNESSLEVFNDRFSGVCCFYRVIRTAAGLAALHERLSLICHSREEFETCRDTWNNTEDEVERAAKWWFSHQCSFTKKAQSFARSTKGKNQTGNSLRNNLQWFEPTHRRLRNVIIENQDWRLIFKDYDNSKAVFYCDPTYVSYAKGMYKHEMTVADHQDLVMRIHQLEGYVALSGQSDVATHAIYDKYLWSDYIEYEIDNNFAGLSFSDTNHLAPFEGSIKRKKVSEGLWIKY